MKTALSLGIALLALATAAQAEVFRPQVSAVSRAEHRRFDRGDRHRGHGHVFIGYNYYRPYVYDRSYYPGYRLGYYDGYGYDYPYVYSSYPATYSGSNASAGLWLGALAGGIIGHNSGDLRHNGWRGAAWGAGLGWVLGSIADARQRAAVTTPSTVTVPAVTTVAAPVAPVPAAPAAAVYRSAESPMSAANSLFGR